MATELASPKTGLFQNLSRSEYERLPGINFSSLRHMARTPCHFRAELTAPKEPTKAMDFGSALHVLCLEESRFESEYVRGLDVGRRSSADKQLWAEFQEMNAGRTVLTGAEFDQLHEMKEALFQNQTAKELLSCQGMNEVSVVWIDIDSGVTCKGRIDRLCQLFGHTFITDLKTTLDASNWAFRRDVTKYQYHVQAAFYGDALRSISDYERRFLHVVIEKDSPHCSVVYELDEAAISVGRKEYKSYLKLYAECMANSTFPGYAPGIHPLSLPKWAQGDIE